MTAAEQEFFTARIPAAQATQRISRVPASVTLAQATLESGWGQSQLARECNNDFGIKAVHLTDPNSYREFETAEWIKSRKIEELQPFVRYATLADGFTAHALLLSTASRYAPAMKVSNDARAFCVELQACGYSTSEDPTTHQPNYAKLLLEIINEFDLTQYDVDPPPAAAKAAA